MMKSLCSTIIYAAYSYNLRILFTCFMSVFLCGLCAFAVNIKGMVETGKVDLLGSGGVRGMGLLLVEGGYGV